MQTNTAHQPHSDKMQTNEHDLAEYLLATPEFFVRHGHVLANIRVPEAHAGRAISLQERQLDVLRERERRLQGQLSELMQLAHRNEQIAARLARWTHELLQVRQASEVPDHVVTGLTGAFDVPQVALRLWDVLPEFEHHAYDRDVDADTRRMTDALMSPYCGLKGDIAQARWLDSAGRTARSVALLPLRAKPVTESAIYTGAESAQSFGLIVLGSTDADRFQTGMGTEFLERIAQTASAALARLVAT